MVGKEQRRNPGSRRCDKLPATPRLSTFLLPFLGGGEEKGRNRFLCYEAIVASILDHPNEAFDARDGETEKVQMSHTKMLSLLSSERSLSLHPQAMHTHTNYSKSQILPRTLPTDLSGGPQGSGRAKCHDALQTPIPVRSRYGMMATGVRHTRSQGFCLADVTKDQALRIHCSWPLLLFGENNEKFQVERRHLTGISSFKGILEAPSKGASK